MSTQPTPFLTPQQYVDLENRAEHKNEYVNGELFAMAGASPQHGRLVRRIVIGADRRIRRGCEVFFSDVRLRVEVADLFTYPDAMIVCGELAISAVDPNAIMNPIVIFEVLSPSTEAWDRGRKFAYYRSVPSLQEYVLVSQDETRVEVYTRQPDGATWSLTEVSDPGGAVRLASVDIELPMAEIYRPE